MRGILATIIITVVITSIFEMLLPSGNIKKVALSVMGIIVIAIILSPIVSFISQLKTKNSAQPVYNFYEGGMEIEKKF